MTQVDRVKADIEQLPHEDFIRLRDWIAEVDSQQWDKQIEEDSQSGKLDFLREEAMNAKAKGQLKNL